MNNRFRSKILSIKVCCLQVFLHPLNQVVLLILAVSLSAFQRWAVFHQLFFFDFWIRFRIYFSCNNGCMPQKISDVNQIDTCLQEMHSLTVTETMVCNSGLKHVRILCTCYCNVFIYDVLYPCAGEFLTPAVYEKGFVCIQTPVLPDVIPDNACSFGVLRNKPCFIPLSAKFYNGSGFVLD